MIFPLKILLILVNNSPAYPRSAWNFLFCACIGAVVSAPLSELRAQDQNPGLVKISMDVNTISGRVSPDFIGLGYETSAVAQSNYFSARNSTLIQLYRNLSTKGLIRIGGNVSDHAKFIPDGVSAVHSEKEVSIINRQDLIRLSEFSRATGWKVMWGLNLGTGTKAEAVEEALAVNQALDGRLQSFQIGNEVDLLPRFKQSYEAYHAAYLDFKMAIRNLLPNASFSGPDVAGSWDYIQKFAGTESPDIRLLTHHYYRGGARESSSTIEKLLAHDESWSQRLEKLRDISRENQTAFRINEVNSFYGGGKSGVSDTFASALWCLDYMFQLAADGCEGINVETDINQLGWISHYSPIVHDGVGECSARPEYYGMLAFATAGHGDLLKLTLDGDEINLSAYATKNAQGLIWITVINKDLSRDAAVEMSLPKRYNKAEGFRLTAPSVVATNQVTFAGAELSARGTWTPKSPEKIPVKKGVATVSVPHASAILVRLR